VLWEYASSLPNVTIRNGVRLESLTQTEGGVNVGLVAVGGGSVESRHVDYLIGADGSKSTVRDLLGIQMRGRGGISKSINIIFRAPTLRRRLTHDDAIHYWAVTSKGSMLLGPLNLEDLWWTIFQRASFEDAASESDEDAARDLVRSALPAECADEIEILHVTPWEASELIADRYRDDRVFLIGDAAHLHPPAGGHGMNAGISDGVDLAWKLAAVIEGWGGPLLLDSYDRERRTVHERIIENALSNWSAPAGAYMQDSIDEDSERGESIRRRLGSAIAREKLNEFFSIGLVLGYRYDRSPLIFSDGTPAPPADVAEYLANARPGSLAPHVRLSDGSAIFDHFGAGFTLLALADGVRTDAFVAAALGQGVPLNVVAIAERHVRELYEADLVLVRPDQHVAWRGTVEPVDAAHILAVVRGATAQASVAESLSGS
jgi:2-polyprenyl-6-methoxyphenol hydroxylase-like FAD-dependent oxidoreductase